MSFRIGTLLCLTGLAACSHDHTPPAQSSYDASAPANTKGSEAMTPASLEASQSSIDRTAAGPRADSAPASRQNAAATTAATTEQVDSTAPTAPAAQTNPATAPDNTKVNERDRNTANPTSGDQGENETDLKITQQIRQAVMADDSLSFTAKNVKIITQGGKVTLRGPVNTEAERRAIEAAARKVAGATQVNNQLEVKK